MYLLSRNKIRSVLIGIGLLLAIDTAGAGTTALTVQDARNSYVLVDLGFTHYSLQGDNRQRIIGDGAKVSFGLGGTHDHWLWRATGDILWGPFFTQSSKQPKTDFNGSGATIHGGYGWGADGLRSTNGSFGLLFGGSYREITGRTATAKFDTAAAAEKGIPPRVKIYGRDVNWDLGLFFALFQPSRPNSNDPNLLVTRIEGIVFSVIASFPYISRYRTSKEPWLATDPAIEEKYRLRRHSITLAISVPFGT